MRRKIFRARNAYLIGPILRHQEQISSLFTMSQANEMPDRRPSR